MRPTLPEPLETSSDEALARRAQGGDWAGFDELVRRFEARIYRFTLHSCRRPEDARELTQETFVSAYLHLARYDPALSFAAWLFTIARRKCVDRARRIRRWSDRTVPEQEDTNDPSSLLAQREASAELWRQAKQVLSTSQFHALWLRYVEDLSIREIARVMRRTSTHVKVLLFRARKRLASEWRPGGAAQAAAAAQNRSTLPAELVATFSRPAP